MISYSAAMASWTQIKEGLGQVNSQLTAGKAVTAEILMIVIGYLAAITDMGNRMESQVTTEFGEVGQTMSTEFGEVKQKILVHQGAIEVLAARPEKNHTGGARGILENKSVTSLPMLGKTRIRSATGTIAW